MAKTVEYDLSIKTTNASCAGTDNDVFITVYGEIDGTEVSTGEINLSSQVRGNAFEKADQHNLTFQWEDIGRPTKIKLRLGNTYSDDWKFAWCTIQRRGTETTEEDPEINKKVSFNGNDKKFARKDSYFFYADLGVLREKIVNQNLTQVYGGVEFITLPHNGETQINMAFSKSTSNIVEKSTVTQNTTSHTINVGAEASYSPGGNGGWGGKGSISYGFSYSTLKSIADSTANSLTETSTKETSVKIVNSGNVVTEYTLDNGLIKRTVEENSDKTFAIIYEETIVVVDREREGSTEYKNRRDTLNIGRRVRAVLPLTLNAAGNLVYINATGKEFAKDKLWDAVS